MSRHNCVFLYFVGALLLLRAIFFGYFAYTGGETFTLDSQLYLDLAENLANLGAFSNSADITLYEAPLNLVDAQGALAPEVFRTPGYPLFILLLSGLGLSSIYWISLAQELVYVATAFLFFHGIRRLLDEDIARASLVFLLIEPGGLAYPKQVMSETLFLPFVIGAILFVGFYCRDRTWRPAVIAGVLLGLATIVRPAAMYLPILLGTAMWLGARRHVRAASHVGAMVLAFAITLSPWLLRNQLHFGTPYISGQTANMLSNYHVPIVWEAVRAIPFQEGRQMMQRELADAVTAEGIRAGQPINAVEVYKLQQSMAIEELRRVPLDYGLQWTFGVMKTSVGGNMPEFYRIARINPDRLRYFEIIEPSFFRKVLQYLIHQDPLILSELALRGGMAVLVVIGGWAILTGTQPFLWVILLTNLYFVAAPGPMGWPRFRFAVEGFWFIQAWFGLAYLSARFRLPGTQRIVSSTQSWSSRRIGSRDAPYNPIS